MAGAPMDRIAAKRAHLRGLKAYASKGIGQGLKDKYAPASEASAEPEPDGDDPDGGIEAVPGLALDGTEDPGSKPADELSTEELMSILKERLGKDPNADVSGNDDLGGM